MAVSGIYTALSGMDAHRQMLDTTAHNIANQLTPGYSRQVVDLAPASVGTGPQVFTGPGSRVLGVDVVDTRRVLDEMAEGRARQSVATALDSSTTYAAMLELEDVFGEPGELGIANQLDAFWSSWSDLSDRADDTVARNEVLAQASGLVERLAQADAGLDDVVDGLNQRLSTLAPQVNVIAAQVADLNRSIAASATSPNSLLDQRDQLAAQLTTLVGGEVRSGDRGQVSVSVGGRLLVGDGISYDVRHDSAGLVWDADDSVLRPGPSELASVNRLLETTVPELRAELDGVVSTLVAEVNDVHRQGFGLDGVSGRDFFDPAGVTAASIALSSDVAGEPDHLGVGGPVYPGPTAPGVYDGRQAQLLGNLSTTGTTSSGYRTLVAGLGIDTNAASQRASTNQQIADRALDEAESVSGVSLDEELTTMMAAQRGYEASARVLSVVDEMLQTVIGMIR